MSLATGLPDITVPLFTAKGRTLELPIRLRYHGGGIRVEEIGGWVGLGWTLEAGGMITRTVRGLRDEDPDGYYNRGEVFHGPEGQTPSTSLLDEIAQGDLDGEPDQFFFNFAGRSGQFVMGPTSEDTLREVRTIPYQPMRIVPAIWGGHITGWVVTTEDGTRYTFGVAETTTDRSVSTDASIPDNHGDFYNSSWHLTEIRAPGGDVITLNYQEYTTRHRVGEYQERFDLRQSGYPEDCVPSSAGVVNEHERTSQRLVSIQSAAHTVTFHTTNRSDALSPTGIPQEPQLNTVRVATPSDTVLREYRFAYGYFGGNRLRLDAVAEHDKDGTPLPPYTFEYDPQSFPALNSYAQDHWGYWNGKANTSLIPSMIGPTGALMSGADRRPVESTMTVGSLERITYPTGGFTELDWEANDYGGVTREDAVPWVDMPTQVALLHAEGTEGLVTTTFSIGGQADVPVSVTVSIDPEDPECGQACVLGPSVELNPGGGRWTASTQASLILSPGTYTLEAYSDVAGGHAEIKAVWQERVPITSTGQPGKIAGGLRIAEVRTSDGRGNTQARSFDYTRAADPTRSSGIINHEPRYDYVYNSALCYYFSRSSMSKMALGDGAPVVYTEVTVLHGANGEFGRTRETFRTFLDQPDPAPVYEKWPYSRVTSYAWKRGQRVESTIYDELGNPQRREVAEHEFADGATVTRRFPGISLNSFSAGRAGPTYVYNPFEVISAWTHPVRDTIETFDESGTSSLSTTRSYTYGNPVHAQVTELTEVNYDGTERITRTKYPADYPNADSGSDDMSQALAAMQGEAHMHNSVIERWVIERSNTSDVIVQAELNTFKEFGLGEILPYRRFLLNSPSPVQ